MLKSAQICAGAVTLFAAVALLLPLPHRHAAAQSPGYVNAVDLDIVPAEMDKYMAAIKENGAAAVKEPGCREFNITVLASNPNHVFLFEVYDDAAALEAHRQTEHFKKYAALTANMVAQRNVRALTPVAFNMKAH
jgi:(4S)-4-hydroxy-5-phosphonooxypentane-2,3-dione isomerase